VVCRDVRELTSSGTGAYRFWNELPVSVYNWTNPLSGFGRKLGRSARAGFMRQACAFRGIRQIGPSDRMRSRASHATLTSRRPRAKKRES
jgi:hypothetical protein